MKKYLSNIKQLLSYFIRPFAGIFSTFKPRFSSLKLRLKGEKPARQKPRKNTTTIIFRYLALAAIIFTVISCTDKNKVRIDGTFAGIGEEKIFLEKAATGGKTIIDSVVTSKVGDFRLKFKTDSESPAFYNLYYKGSLIPLVLSPGERVSVTSIGDLSRNYMVEGSAESDLLKDFNTIYGTNLEKLDSLSGVYSYLWSQKAPQEQIDKVMLEYAGQYNIARRDHAKFILDHPGSMAALYALYLRLPGDTYLMDQKRDMVYFRVVADSLGAKYPGSPYVAALRRDVNEMEKGLNLAQELIDKSESGFNFPDIELPDMFGNIQKLSNLYGKVILLDFWTPADINNKTANAELKQIYNNFKDRGLEIYQVALTGDKALWINTVQAQNLPWTTVLDTREGAGMAAMSYNITAVPANFLIDKQGNIVASGLPLGQLPGRIEQLVK